jgi:hypothetical protein
MGVNNSWSIFRPNLWLCVDRPGSFLQQGWKDPSILKILPLGHRDSRLRRRLSDGTFVDSPRRPRDMPACLYYIRNESFDPSTFLSEATVNWGGHRTFTDSLGIRGSRSVMLAALRIAHYLGFANVYLLGADFRMTYGGENYAFPQGRSKASVRGNNKRYDELNRRFEALRPYFRRYGFAVYNCTRGS